MALRIETFIAAAATVALFASPSAAEGEGSGAFLFENCIACHGERGEGNDVAAAPAIAGLSDWYVESQLTKFRNGWRGGHPDDHAGLRMRPMSRTLATDEEVTAVAAYVASLPKTNPEPVLEGGDATRGKTLYQPCVACHGAKGEGRKPLSGPALAYTNDWYLLEQLHKFKSGVRGGNAQDKTGAMMRAMSGTLTDEQVMKDIIAHIATLPVE